MNEARQAAAQAGNVTGPIGDSAGVGQGEGENKPAITYGEPGKQMVLAGPGVDIQAELDRPGNLLGDFRFRGNKLDRTAYQNQIIGTIEFEQGIATVPNLELTIVDIDGQLYKQFDALWYRGTKCTYLDLELTVNEISFEPGPHGSGQLVIKMIDSIVYDLFMLRGARTESNMDATAWIASELKMVRRDPDKMFLGESVPSQSTISRDVPPAAQNQNNSTPPWPVANSGAGTNPATGSPIGADTGTIRYDGYGPRLSGDPAVAGYSFLGTPYVSVPDASFLRKMFLLRNRDNNLSVVVQGGCIGAWGGMSYAAAQALEMGVTSAMTGGTALRAQRTTITDYVAVQVQPAKAPAGAQSSGGKVVEAYYADVPGTARIAGIEANIEEDNRSEGKLDSPTAWSTGVRLGKELGKRFFVSGHRLVFGSAGFCLRWVRPYDKDPEQLGWNGFRPDDLARFMEIPTVTRVAVGKREGIIQVVGKIMNSRAAYLRPGSGVTLYGIPGVRDSMYMVQKIKHSLGTDFDGAEIELIQPVNPPPEPPTGGQENAAEGAGGSGTTSGGGADGQIDTFVNLCLAQAGDRYVFGAEVKMSDPNPSVWDCSELVEWAAFRAGIKPKVPDGSSAQKAHCTPISVREGIATKGALLFHPGHVAVSLGNGRTIEAYTSSKPVGQLNAGGRFNAAGLIPGATGYRRGGGG
jgi:hypothetical protein